MDNYVQLKRFCPNRQLQVYMYAFMYVDPETIPVEYHFTVTKTFVDNYKKISTPGPVTKHWLGFIYIRSKYYELNQDFDDTKLKNKLDHTSNDKVKLFHENVFY